MPKRKQQTNHRSGNNLILVVMFAVCVLFLIVVSLVIKFFNVWNMSTFDGSHRFTTLVSDSQNQSVLVTVDPAQNVRGKLIINDALDVDEVLSEVPIAVDGIVVLSTEFDPDNSVTELLQTALIKRNELRHQLTFIDLVRLYISARTTHEHEASDNSVSLPLNDSQHELLSELFVDDTVQEEGLTIAIENATNISGVGGHLEAILSNMGAEVISVETAVRKQPESRITYYEEDTYTLRKLQSLLGYEVVKNERIGISDISIIIGEDGLSNTLLQTFRE